MTTKLINLTSVIALVVVTSAHAGTAFTFTPAQGNSGDWKTQVNWTPAGHPEAGDNVTIPLGKRCFVTEQEAIDYFKVQSSGILEIKDDGELNLGTNVGPVLPSTVDKNGVLDLTSLTATLTIKSDVTIQGSGFIQGQGGGIIDGHPNRLTIDQGLTLTGDLEIRCKFTNSAIVWANDNLVWVRLGSEPLGDGTWKASGQNSTLWFDQGTWPSDTLLTGDFIIIAQGAVLVEESNVKTSGHLIFKDGFIVVTKDFRFKVDPGAE